MYKDRLILALQVARIKLEIQHNILLGGVELQNLLEAEPLISSFKASTEEPQSDLKRSETRGFIRRLKSRQTVSATVTDEMYHHLSIILTSQQTREVTQLTFLQTFTNLIQHIIDNSSLWRECLNSVQPELQIPNGCIESTSADAIEETLQLSHDSAATHSLRKMVKQCIRETLIIKALRPDRLGVMLTRLVEIACGTDFLKVSGVSQEDLHLIVTTQIKSTTPILLIASAGFDPSSKIIWAAQKQNQSLASIAMGSEEGYAVADKSIASAARQGTWVLVKNVHLSLSWLQDLEKKLFRIALHEKFRIFLTMEWNENVSRNLFRISFKFIFEPPAGLRASMLRTYDQFLLNHPNLSKKPTVARNRLYYLISFLHAVVLERKRYIPFGWSKEYEFSDADQTCAITVIDQWLDKACFPGAAVDNVKKISNDMLPETLDPEKIPFESIRELLKSAVYGGRLDNEVDQRALASFINYIFRQEAFESDFPLCYVYGDTQIQPLYAPNLLRSEEQYKDYVNQMRSVDEPLWLGLSPRADRLISARQGINTLTNWFSLHSKSTKELQELLPTSAFTRAPTRVSSEDFTAQRTKISSSMKASGWLEEVQEKTLTLIDLLPATFPSLVRSKQAINDPMFRCFDREVASALTLLDLIRSDLTQLIAVCEGQCKFVNYTRRLAQSVASNKLQAEWQALYTGPCDIPLSIWLLDFCKRVAQLRVISIDFGLDSNMSQEKQTAKYMDDLHSILGEVSPPLSQRVVWFGGLQFPKAFLTATRQYVAQKINCSLDDLKLCLDIGKELETDEQFLLGGAVLENASWDARKNSLTLTDTLSMYLPPIRLSWISRLEKRVESKQPKTEIPLFLTASRTMLVTMADFAVEPENSMGIWYQRGVALILWNAT